MKKDIRRNILPDESTLEDVLTALNKGIYGIVFIADKDERIVGIFTDGDVRRALLKEAELKASVLKYMKKDFVFAKEGQPKDYYVKMLSENIRHLPILDRKGCLVDFISWAEMWRLPVMEPSLGGNELKYVSSCITSNWISSQGSYVKAFESEFASYHGVKFSLTTSSGTTALHLALVALRIGPGDEVIVPDLTFAASANTVVHSGAKPVFVDVSEEHWTIDPEKIETSITPNTRAIMPVHLYGHPCDMDSITAIATKHKLYIIEDCAEALGAKYKGQVVGTLGNVGCFSFFSNKVITTGEGGMVTTNDAALYEKMMVLRDHGMSRKKRYWHEFPGFNYRMTNLQAAVGLAQMERITDFLDYRRQVVERYNQQLRDVAGIVLPPEAEWAKNIYWLYSIIVDEQQAGINRDGLAVRLADYGIETRPFFYPLHVQPPYQSDESNECPVTSWLASHGLSLPTGNDIRLEDVDRVCVAIKQTIADARVVQGHMAVT